MELDCKKCGAPVPVDHIDFNRRIATCSYCGTSFVFGDAFGEADGFHSVTRYEIPMPPNYRLEHTGSDLKITRRWFRPTVIPLTIFTLLWNGFMLFWFGIAISQKIWMMALCGSLHGAVGIFLLYGVLVGYLNRTIVSVNMQELSVWHGPLPYPGNKRLDSFNIEQLYSKAQLPKSSDSSPTFEVHIITREGKDEKLLTNLDESEQALYLEQEIERYLGIKDQAVRGELPR